MNLYKTFIKPVLFLFTPETAHKIVFTLLKIPGANFFLKIFYKTENNILEFRKNNFFVSNKIGLAAGLDKDGEVVNQLGNIGFGFVEIGTVTPLAQPGNPKPRLFRLKKDNALINRMGFNNKGAEKMKETLKKIKNKNTTIGINLGKNKITPIDNAYLDYKKSFEILFDYADYFAINVSSPNTPNLRELQDKKHLSKILEEIQKINLSKKTPKPVFLKIAPDLTFQQIDEIIKIVKDTKINGLIATNTTIERTNLKIDSEQITKYGNGGLSGNPLKNKSTEIIKYIKSKISDDIILIGVGGISSLEDVEEKIQAGADLVQLYTSFIYEGPGVVKKLKKQMITKNL